MSLESYIAERGLVVVTAALDQDGRLCAITTIHRATPAGAAGPRWLVHYHETDDPAILVRRHGRIVDLVRSEAPLNIAPAAPAARSA